MKKKLSACIVDSTVHPSQDEDWVALGNVNKTKVMELLGVANPQEYLEIDDLLSRTHASDASSSCDDIDKALAFPLPTNQKPSNSNCADITHVSLRTSRPTYVQQQHNPLVKAAFVQELAISHWAPKLFKFQCLTGMSLVLDSANQRAKPSQLQLRNVKGGMPINSPRQEGSFPLPPPRSEKHYLPSPLIRQGSPVAHPLPPPLSRSSSNEHASISTNEKNDKLGMVSRQTVSCSLPIANEFSRQEAMALPSPMSKLDIQARAPHMSSSISTNDKNDKADVMSSRTVSCSLPIVNEFSAQEAMALPNPMVKSDTHARAPHMYSLEASNGQFIVSTTHKSPSLPSSTRQSPRLSGSFRSAPNSPLRPSSASKCPRKWRKGAILGQGTFGIVHEGLNLEDGSFFAVKVSSSADVSPEIQQEVDVLSKLEHPNIVRYLGSSIEDGHLCIFLELVRMGSLETILRKYKRFEDNTIRSYTRQILLGLEYLHAKKTMHRDIKCANILVDVNGQVKLSDFGVAKEVDDTFASSLKGTPLYMAPEVLTPKKNRYTFSADIWSLGCTVLEMADGKPPWSNLHGFGFLFKINNRELPPMPDHLSPEGKDFVCRCLKFNAKDRPTALELLQHPFVVNVSTPEPFIPRAPPSPVECRESHLLSQSLQCTL